jgi:hypothetical protein
VDPSVVSSSLDDLSEAGSRERAGGRGTLASVAFQNDRLGGGRTAARVLAAVFCAGCASRSGCECRVVTVGWAGAGAGAPMLV